MVGDSDSKGGDSADADGDVRADPHGPTEDEGVNTVTWDSRIAPPRIAPDPLAGLPPKRPAVSQSADTIVTESGAAMPENMDLHLTSGEASTRVGVVFERVEPSSARGERIRLDPTLSRVRVGRSESNEFRLLSASTSRKHAVLERNFEGRWVLSALGGKDVKVDGYPLEEPLVVEPGMYIVMGGDHFRSVDGDAADRERTLEPQSAHVGSGWSAMNLSAETKRRAIGWLLALVGLGILAAVLLSSTDADSATRNEGFSETRADTGRVGGGR